MNIALLLAEASLSRQHIATPARQELDGTLEPMLEQRARGKGWDDIANAMGFRLGELMHAERARSEAPLVGIEGGGQR